MIKYRRDLWQLVKTVPGGIAEIAERLTRESLKGTKYIPIPGFDGYIVGDDGSVWSLWRPPGNGGGHIITSTPRRKKLRKQNSKKRYPEVWLVSAGKRILKSVHFLVLSTFRGPKPDPKMECRHLDGNRFNFHLSNLVWGTKKENQQDKERHGTCQVGCANGRAKLNKDAVLEIRKRRNEGATYKALASEFGIYFTTIAKICNRQLWKSV